MVLSLGLNGVTKLTEWKFTKRYKGLKSVVHHPNRTFSISTGKPSQHICNRKARKKLSGDTPSTPTPRTRTYSINKTKVRQKIPAYLNSMPGQKMLFFWTVTFPKGTQDDICYLLLNKWLTRLRTELRLVDYLWIAERQQNGTIHYHIAVNQYIDIRRANRYMRSAIMRSIDKDQIDWTRSAAANYNGIEIAKNKKTGRVVNFAKQKNQRSLTLYLTKYITKNDGTFKRLAWHCSRGYSEIITHINCTIQEFIHLGITHLLNKTKIIQQEHYTFIPWSNGPPQIITDHINYCNQQVRSILTKSN